MYELNNSVERAVSVHPRLTNSPRAEAPWKARCNEFEKLVESSHCQLIESLVVNVRQITPATLLGSGQLAEVGKQLEELEVEVVFIDHRISPVQQSNLETAWQVKVVDRTGLILEIFADRARTREGILQVELASLNYQLGRLVRSWTHLERQRGGHGFLGGPGERQIELDRRMIRDSIKRLEKELILVRKMRTTQRASRVRNEIQTIALVGYTNAGKSTLFNRLCQADVHAADQLFATLDPTLRKLELPGGLSVMLSDTVGFVQDLPHELVDAFRSTLEEVLKADLILHVRDMADSESAMQKQVVEETLQQMGLEGDAMPPMIEILNKHDLAPQLESRICDDIDGSRLPVSALHGSGMGPLLELLGKWIQRKMDHYVIDIPASDGRTLAFCHANAVVSKQELHEETVTIHMQMSPRFAKELGIKDDDEDDEY